MLIRVLLAAVLGISAAGCPASVCDPTDTRCVGSTAEICGSDGVWRALMDCEPEGMICCAVEADPEAGVPSGHTCLPDCGAPPADGGGDAR